MVARRKSNHPVKRRNTEVVASSGNIFADLGFRNAVDLHTRGQLIFRINAILQERALTQAAAASLLGLTQADVSRLMKGEFVRRFTTERLFRVLNRLGRDVEIRIRPTPRSRTTGQVSVSPPG